MANNRLMLVNDSNKTFIAISKTYGTHWQSVINPDRLDKFLMQSKADGQFGDTKGDTIRAVEEIDVPDGYQNVL